MIPPFFPTDPTEVGVTVGAFHMTAPSGFLNSNRTTRAFLGVSLIDVVLEFASSFLAALSVMPRLDTVPTEFEATITD